MTVTGYRFDSGLNKLGSIWTAATGVQVFMPPPGFTNIEPAAHAISNDGSVSVGLMAAYDTYLAAIEAYRWTPGSGFEGLGHLPGGTYGGAIAVSGDGKLILGQSDYDPELFNLNYSDLFLWSEAGDIVDLGRPLGLYGSFGSGSLTPDGEVAAVSTIFSQSFIVRTAEHYFFDFEQILTDAGLADAISGWSGFSIGGMTPDASTVYGSATDPDGNLQGFIAQFPAGYPVTCRSHRNRSSPATRR